jgi:Ca-activated chloride channel family protein
MTDVELSLDVEAARESDGRAGSRMYPRSEFDLFAGDQAVVVGRYAMPGDAKVRLSGKIAGEKESFDFPAKLVRHSDDDTNAFVAKLWATRRVGAIIDEIDLKGKNEELIKELVDLATEHGILTPYTSFLADETQAHRDRLSAEQSVREQLSDLDAAEGDFGFRQREAKAAYQFAARPATLDAVTSGLGGAGPANDAGRSVAIRVSSSTGGQAAWYYDALQDRQVASTTCITVGRKTFFRRGERWVDASVTPSQENAAIKIERFSDEYFKLIDRHGRHVASFLAIDASMCIKLDGNVYQW